MNKKVIAGVVVGIVLLAALLWWAITESYKPLPGKEAADEGRDHITDITGITYNSNPPTSGKHFPVWAKKGVYDRVLSDGYLIHSLEHGYIVISYDCTKLSSKLKVESSKLPEENSAASTSGALMRMTVQLSGEMSAITPEHEPAVEVPLPDSFKSAECKKLVSDLPVFLKDWQRIVIVPRLNLDVPIALTAWNHIEKLQAFDKKKIQEFISAYHNKGPEATVE